MIAIVDYGNGNLSSVKNALDFLKAESKITSNPKEIGRADRIIFPGVGSFGYMMEQLRKKELEKPIKNSIRNGKPFLGICLGLQVLFEESEESKGIKGLEIFKGRVVKFTKGKVPQVGWNNIKPTKKGILQNGFGYFVNSYYVVPKNREIAAAKTDYFNEFVSAVQKNNVTGVQFHPEKSGEFGLRFLKRWLEC